MKKFSKLTGQNINSAPEVETKQASEADLFKTQLMGLMDQILNIRTYGPVDNHQRAGLIKIAGKEMLAQAILDLVSEDTTKKQAKILEELKSEVGDWESIDAKILSLKQEKILLCNRNKFNFLLEKYRESPLLIEVVGASINKINTETTLSDYIKLTVESKLTHPTKSKLIQIYSTRLNQLSKS